MNVKQRQQRRAGKLAVSVAGEAGRRRRGARRRPRRRDLRRPPRPRRTSPSTPTPTTRTSPSPCPTTRSDSYHLTSISCQVSDYIKAAARAATPAKKMGSAPPTAPAPHQPQHPNTDDEDVAKPMSYDEKRPLSLNIDKLSR